MDRKFVRLLSCSLLVLAVVPALGQRKKSPTPAKPRPVIFAVLNDGSWIEPIAYVRNGKLEHAVDNASDAKALSAFARTYYGRGAKYPLIFGGTEAGIVSVKSSDTQSECGKSIADILVTSPKARLRGNVMALATNVKSGPATGTRRMPTAAERSAIDTLVRAEFEARGSGPSATKKLRSQNLTALDVDHDGKIEFVGTYWVEVSPKTRALLFLIAQQGTDGKIMLASIDHRLIEEKDLMEGAEMSSVDEGAYHERLLDVLDVDGDGIAEVFTYIQSFEGAGFNVYKRANAGWTKVYEGSNYHCAF